MKQIITAINHPITVLGLLLIPTIVIWVMVFTMSGDSDRLRGDILTRVARITAVTVPKGKGEPFVTLAPSPTAPQVVFQLPTITAIPTNTPLPQPTVTPWPTMASLPTPTLFMLPTLSPLLYPTAIIWPTDTPLPQVVALLPTDTPTPWPTDTLLPAPVQNMDNDWAITDYLSRVHSATTIYGLSFTQIGSLFQQASNTSPVIFSDEWKIQVAIQLALIRSAGEDIRKLSAPSLFQPVHVLLLATADHCDNATNLIVQAIDNHDATLLAKASEEMQMGGLTIRQATQLLEEIRN